MSHEMVCPNCQTRFVAVDDDAQRDDTVLRFVEEKLELHGRTESAEFRDAFLNWAREEGLQIPTPQAFGRALRANRVGRIRSNGRRYYVATVLG